jgi:radical SAM superfamily enzyme YgiQ (UPF0313 family)
VLINPPQVGLLDGFSVGLISLANHVTRALPEVEVRLLDLGTTDPRELDAPIRKCLVGMQGEIVAGITTTTASYQSALIVARRIRHLFPRSLLILGGHHASTQDEAVLTHHPQVDAVVRGEGERALAELLRHHSGFEKIPNLSYRRDGLVVRNPLGPLLEQDELDSQAVRFPGLLIRSAPGKFGRTTYVSARGCPHGCSFCSVANERIRTKSVDAVIRDLRCLVQEYGYRQIAIEDNFFAHTPRRTIRLCRAIEALQQECAFGWDCQTRVESCRHEDVLRAMERAGCEAVYLGVEAMNPRQLLYLNKTRHPESYIDLLQDVVVPRLLRSRIACLINIQTGLPGEEARERENTLRILRNLGRAARSQGKTITIFPQLHVTYPGTVHFRAALKSGIFGPDGASVFERFTEWEAHQQPVLRWLGERFAHGTGGIPEGILDVRLLHRGEFAVDPIAVLGIVNYLDEMSGVPGIEVFRYHRYLAGSHSEESPRSPGTESC